MTSRLRLMAWVGFVSCIAAGCDSAGVGIAPIPYRESERAATDLVTKPKLRAAIGAILAKTFGPDVQHMKVPDNSGLRDGGVYLAGGVRLGDKVEPSTEVDAKGKARPVAGGYALYRNNCLHCHGVFGAGDGPTAAFLFPRPRDYRPGIFKFTSTNPTNAKPSRDDLRKTLLYGLHGTSMPGFEAIMTNSEIEQVIDYMVFLSIRGETERYLIDEAMNAEDKDAEQALEPDLVAEIVQKVTASWTEAESQVVNPTVRRVASTPESVRRGRDLFLGANSAGPKLECVGCHGANGQGNGPAFVDRTIFDDVVFRQYSFDEAAARTFRAEAEDGGSHGEKAGKSDPEGLGPFLAANPAILKILRDDHKLLLDDSTDPQFAYLVQRDMPRVAKAARALVPELDDPKFRAYLVAKYDLWTNGSLDVWKNPLRPANLVSGVYKGGRRPLDLYWRLAKGINGAKMPAHAGILSEEQIWDIVNFVLALPEEPGLLPEPAPNQPESKSVAATSPRPVR